MLLAARDKCEHGAWHSWLKENFEGSIRTAQLYMKLTRNRAKLAEERYVEDENGFPNAQRVARPVTLRQAAELVAGPPAPGKLQPTARDKDEQKLTVMPPTKKPAGGDEVEGLEEEQALGSAREPGALEVLRQEGVEIPPYPSGKTREDKVMDIRAKFFVQMKEHPVNPEDLARGFQPMQAAAWLYDVSDARAYFERLQAALQTIVDSQRELEKRLNG